MMNSILEPSNFIKYHKSLKLYLGISQDRLTPVTSARVAKARQKLSRLTEIQFYDLSTDVYDELQRRINETNEKPKHLLPQSNYHPKRNQARQKLAALPSQRFKDLVNDVLFEIDRRHLAEQPSIDRISRDSPNLNDYPSAREPSQHAEMKLLSPQRPEHSLPVQNVSRLDVDSRLDSTDEPKDEVKTPVRENFPRPKVETPSQREITATKVVPKRAELTWSSDEEEDSVSFTNHQSVRSSLGSKELKNISRRSRLSMISSHNSLAENVKLKETLKAKDEEIVEKLRAKDEEIEEKLKAKDEDIEEKLKAKDEDMEERLKAKDQEIEDLNEQLSALKEHDTLHEEKVNNLELELEEKDSNIKSLKGESSKFSELEVTNAEQLSKIAELQDQLHTAISKTRELDSLREKYQNLQEKCENGEVKTDSRDLDEKVLDLEQQNKSLQQKNKLQENSYVELKEKHDTLLKQHTLLQKDHAALQKTMERISTTSNDSDINLKQGANETANSLWQKKYQELKAGNISNKILSTEAPDLESLQRYCDLDGSVPLMAIANLYAGVEMMLSYVSEEKISTLGLFSGVSGIAYSVQSIAKDAGSTDPTSKVGEKTQLIEASLSNLLTSTRYYALYLDVMPKLLIHAAINDVYFSVLDLVSLRKIHAVGDSLVQAVKDSRSRGKESLQAASNQKVLELTQTNVQSQELNLQKDGGHLASFSDYALSNGIPEVPKFDGDRSDASTPPRTPTEEETLAQVKPLKMAEKLSSQEDLTRRSNSDSFEIPRKFKGSLPAISPIRVRSPEITNKYDDGKDETQQSEQPLTLDTTSTNGSGKGLEKPSTIKTTANDQAIKQLGRPIENTNKNVMKRETAKKQAAPLTEKTSASSSQKAKESVHLFDQHTVSSKAGAEQKSHAPSKNSPSTYHTADMSVSSLASKFSEISSNDSTPRNSNGRTRTNGSVSGSSKINKFKQQFEQNRAESLKQDSFISSASSASPSPVKYHRSSGEVAKAFNKFGAKVNPTEEPAVSRKLFTDDDERPKKDKESDYDSDQVEAKPETIQRRPPYEENRIESSAKVPEPKAKYVQGSGSTEDVAGSNNIEMGEEETENVEEDKTEVVTNTEETDEKEDAPTRATTEEEEENFDFENFNTLDPDNTLKELLLYLEHQTVEVISAIQQLLQSIRNPKATRGLLRGAAELIITVVKQMCEGTKTLMGQSRYADAMGHAQYVVDVLDDCVVRMDKLYGNDHSKDEMYADKDFKQRSAGIAFDIARSTKELVKTVEEASLRDEIAVLDSRLNAPNHA